MIFSFREKSNEKESFMKRGDLTIIPTHENDTKQAQLREESYLALLN